MKNTFFTIVILLFQVLSIPAFSQNWKRTYTYPERHSEAYSVTEAYDKGYLLLSNFLKNGSSVHTGWLIKTDINGNKLWERFIGNYDGYESAYEKLIETSDQGIVLAGSWTKTPYSNSIDPLFVKLNACGNLEWCQYFKTDDHGDFGVNIIEVSDGYIGLMAYYGYDYFTQRIALTKLNLEGNVEWVQTYHSDSAINEEGRTLRQRSNGDIMVTGEANVIKPGSPYQQPRPLFILTEPDGTLKDFGVLDVSDTLWSTAWQTKEKPNGIFYSTGGIYVNPPSSWPYPYFLKTNSNKEILESKLLVDTAIASCGETRYLDFLSDTTLVMSYCFNYKHESKIENGLYKLDTLGNILKTRTLLHGEDIYYIEGLDVTQDNKILAFTTEWQEDYKCSVLFKLNSDLEDDSIYTAPYTYDWACPGGVDTVLTIDPDCGGYVNIDELERLPDVSEISISPNPVSDMLTVSLPEYLVSRNAQRGMQASVYIRNYQKDARLEIYTINGTLQCIQPLAPGQREAQFNTGKLSSGIYFVRMIYQNRQVSTVKFVKE